MNLAPNEIQAEIGETADTFLGERLPFPKLRALAHANDGSIDDESWTACADMGWLGLLLPEGEGGLDLGLSEAVMIFREFGRHLTPGPFRSTVLAGLIASAAGLPDLAASLGRGALRAGLGIKTRTGEILAADARVDDLLVTLDGPICRLSKLSVLAVIPGVDPGTPLARVTTGEVLASVEDASIIDKARLLCAAELLGIVEAVRDMSASYAQIREQFGKPIGSFQAVKHRCADMAISAYAMQSQLFMASVRVDAGLPDASFHAAAAHVLAINGAKQSTADNIQNHGGIGITAEHNAHLYLKRAFLLEHSLGSRRESFAALIAPAQHEFN